MKLYGITTFKGPLYYTSYGFIPCSPEFEALIDGQTFEFHDEVFGNDYKLMKQGSKWVVTNCAFNVPTSASINGDTKFFNHHTQPLMIAKNVTNEIILNTLLGFIGDNSLFDIIRV